MSDPRDPAIEPEAVPVPGEAPSSAPGAPPEPHTMPSSQPLLLRALRWGAIATLVLVLVAGTVGFLMAGTPGLVGGLLGAVFSGAFLGLTIGSIAFANRFIGSEIYVVAFFSIVVGGWLVKFVAFILAAVLLRDAEWLEPRVLFFSLIAGVLISLAIDVVIVTRSRLPIVSDPR